MRNPINWLFRDKEIERAEKELEHQLERIKEKVKTSKSSTLVEVQLDFPDKFSSFSEDISIGEVEWRDFYCNKILDIYSVHCRMSKGASIKEHRHPVFCEYIYMISGSAVIWTDGDAEGEILIPPEDVEDEGYTNIDGWFEIENGMSHRIQCLKDNTHFISKFIRISDDN